MNNIRLQILINHYHEPPDLIGRLLRSIAEQTVKDDFNVIIASDGDEYALDCAFLETFPFNIRYSVLPHRGTQATHNALLDMATADYVMFCDADDCFKGADGISKLLDAAKSEPDVVSVPFYAENKDGGLIRIPTNTIWVHGKIFRRAYLLENQIRFDDISAHGEMSFLWLAFHMTDNIRYLGERFYVWKWNEESTTRKRDYYGVYMYDKRMMSADILSKDLIRRERADLYHDFLVGIVISAYIDSKSERWGNAPPEYVEKAKTAIAAFLRRYRSDYERIDKNFRRNRYNAFLTTKRTYGPSEGFDGIAEWMDDLCATF